MSNPIKITKEELYDLYVNKRKTVTEISIMYKCVSTTICNWLKRFGINSRQYTDYCKELSKEYLFEQYVINGKSALEIAYLLGYTDEEIVLKWLKRHNLMDKIKNESDIQWYQKIASGDEQNIPRLNAIDLRGALLGMVLGDAWVGFSSRSLLPKISITHSIEQLDYLIHKRELIRQIPNIRTSLTKRKRFNKGENKEYEATDLISTNNKFLKHIHCCLYKSEIKTVTMHQLKRLTPIGLALWYMDDGSASFRYRNNKERISNRAVKIATHCFSLEEHHIMQRYFKENWGINAKIYRERTKHYLWFQGKEGIKLLNIIAPFIVPSMAYKMDLRYDNPPPKYANVLKILRELENISSKQK